MTLPNPRNLADLDSIPVIKPTKLNIPYHHTFTGVKYIYGAPYRGVTLINEIQNSYISDKYDKIYRLDGNNRHLTDKKRLLLQKQDVNNEHWINGRYRDD